MKRFIAILLVFSVTFSLSGCYISKKQIVDSVKDEVSKEIDNAIDRTKEEVSNKVDEAVDNAKTEISQKIDDTIDGVKTEVGQIADELPRPEDIVTESTKTEETEKSWIDNLKGGIDDILGRDMTITFQPNGGTGGPTEQRFRGGDHILIVNETPTKEGYHFVGWTRQEGTNEPQFFAGKWTSHTFTQDTTLYACWEKYNSSAPFTVHANMGETLNYGGVFELIGGSAGIKDITIEHNYHLIKENDGKTVRIQCDCGFELIDRGISLNNFVTLKSEGRYKTFDSLEAAKQEEYRREYDLYCQRENVWPKTDDVIVETSNGIDEEHGGCSHMPYKYNKKKNVITCKCGTKNFASLDLPELDYKTFATYISVWDTLFQNRDQYGVEAFLRYKGINESFFVLVEAIDIDSNYEQTLDKLEKLSNSIKNLNIAGTVWVNFIGSADLVDEKVKFDKIFGTSLTVVQSLIHLHMMLDANSDPYAACDEFIETIKGPVGLISGAQGIYLVVGLESLKTVLDAYELGSKAHLKEVDYTWYASQKGNGALITWDDLRLDKYKWKGMLTYEHVMGMEKNEATNLPSLNEILEEYPNFTIEGQAYASTYILFCLDLIFEETLGISYTEYIDVLGNTNN